MTGAVRPQFGVWLANLVMNLRRSSLNVFCEAALRALGKTQFSSEPPLSSKRKISQSKLRTTNF